MQPLWCALPFVLAEVAPLCSRKTHLYATHLYATHLYATHLYATHLYFIDGFEALKRWRKDFTLYDKKYYI
jgi:hypothetical protein